MGAAEYRVLIHPSGAMAAYSRAEFFVLSARYACVASCACSRCIATGEDANLLVLQRGVTQVAWLFRRLRSKESFVFNQHKDGRNHLIH